ncbi:hypothetical protein SARC_18264, partial [Sphaeroforma arctica JP610]
NRFDTLLRGSIQLHGPFVGSLLELCLLHPELTPPPETVSAVAMHSGNCTSAAVVLEKRLQLELGQRCVR